MLTFNREEVDTFVIRWPWPEGYPVDDEKKFRFMTLGIDFCSVWDPTSFELAIAVEAGIPSHWLSSTFKCRRSILYPVSQACH